MRERRSRLGVMVWSILTCAVVVILLSGTEMASANQVAAYATDVVASTQGTVVTITARVRATNNGSSPALGLVVAGADGSSIPLGDIPAGGEAVSGTYSFMVDVTGYPSRSLMVPVSLQYTLDGVPTVVEWGLSYLLPE